MPKSKKTPETPGLAPEKTARVVSAVRALCVIFNTSLTYDTHHQVFRAAVEERMSIFRAALEGTSGIPLYFIDGHVRLGSLSLEPGSSLFQKLSERFQLVGISGISIRPGLSPEDIVKLVEIVVSNAEEIAKHGLQRLLSKAGVNTIVEHRVRTQDAEPVSGKRKSKSRPSADQGDVSAENVIPGTWDIGASEASRVFTLEHYDASYATKTFKDFVSGAISALSRKEADFREVADIISTEFEHRLNEKLRVVQREHERKVRLVGVMRDLVLRELEVMHLAALIIDSHLNVLACNQTGRDMLGNASRLETGTSLEAFIGSQVERQVIEINGVTHEAHLLTSILRETGEKIMLVSLE